MTISQELPSQPSSLAGTAGFTVLVNSCDDFEDCWDPFFTLFATYWEKPWPPVLLNTERKHWQHDQVPLTCSAVQRGARRLTWSECLLAALDLITTPLVLYVQEDYFLDSPVRSGVLARCVGAMLADPSIAHVGLTEFGSNGPFEHTKDDFLWRVPQRGKYRISLQAGLWRVDALRSYLRPHENPWMFEILGTRRAWHVPDTFLTLSRQLYKRPENAVLSYIHTGIIKGRWHADIPALFARHGISVDFAGRGFYKPLPRWRTRMQTLRVLLQNPADVLRSL